MLNSMVWQPDKLLITMSKGYLVGCSTSLLSFKLFTSSQLRKGEGKPRETMVVESSIWTLEGFQELFLGCLDLEAQH